MPVPLRVLFAVLLVGVLTLAAINAVQTRTGRQVIAAARSRRSAGQIRRQSRAAAIVMAGTAAVAALGLLFP